MFMIAEYDTIDAKTKKKIKKKEIIAEHQCKVIRNIVAPFEKEDNDNVKEGIFGQ